MKDAAKGGFVDKSWLKATADRIKGIKNIKIIILAIIIALALIIYSSVTASSKSEAYMNEDEMRLAAILSSVEGAGEVEVLITKSSGAVAGVLVLADGAGNPLVRLRLVEAASSALGVEYDCVSVLRRDND